MSDAVSEAPWWPDTEAEEDELTRRAMAALAEVGVPAHVEFSVAGFMWDADDVAVRHGDAIEKACKLAWRSMSATPATPDPEGAPK